MARDEMQVEAEEAFDICQRAKAELAEATARNPTDDEITDAMARLGKLTDHAEKMRGNLLSAQGAVDHVAQELSAMRNRRARYEDARAIVFGAEARDGEVDG
ncbi:MAG: hypothetical protein V4537_14370 [Pseudomonadota bacterium]